MDSLDPRTLEVFRAILETGSATGAAQHLRMTQPAVTRAIAKLEQDTGLTLFERGRFGMRPTTQGELFAQEVRRSYAGLGRLKAVADAIRQGVIGDLSIGALPVLSEGFVARAMGTFAAATPKVRLTVHHYPVDEMVRQVVSGQVDIVVTVGPVADQQGIDQTPLGRRRMMAVMPAGHPLANRDGIDVADLDGVEVVMYAPVNPLRGIILQAFAAAGVVMTHRIEVLTLRGAVRTGLAAGLVSLVDSEIAAEAIGQFPGVRAAPFRAAKSWEVVAVHGRDRQREPIIASALDHLQAAFEISVPVT
jgi:DNA-binding transcriptional LysR family regulator